jgi:putative ABC transport system permease protein
MTALNRKLLRDLRRLGPQILAIAGVLACGIMVLVMATGAERSLTQTRDAYYARNHFADVFTSATRAPRSLLTDIAQIDGVALAEARITGSALLDLPGMTEPATARLLSLPLADDPLLNVPLIRQGRLPDPLRADEVAVAEPFATANALRPGDGLRAVLNGQRRDLVIVGTVLSPEFIYTLSPGSMMPDDKHFALIWMGEAALASAFDLQGAFNDLSLTLTRAVPEAAVIAALDDALAPYGGTGAYGRDRQASNAFLENEFDQLAAMALYLPPVFLIVSAFLVNMVLGRLIRLERQQIGLLKAVGYDTAAIVVHYMKMSLGIGVIGVALGWAIGWGLGQQVTALYADFFRFPFLIYTPGAQSFALSGVLGMATVAAGALRAVLTSANLPPAVAMSPPAPPAFQRGWMDALAQVMRLRQPTMMILRSITRWPGRAMVTVLGVAASVAVLVGSYFTLDVVNVVMTDIFERANRQQVTLSLASARTDAAVIDALSLPGVRMAEGAFALPVRLHFGGATKLVALQAGSDSASLARVLDTNGQPIALPPDGLAIPESLAHSLGIRPGDTVTLDLLAPPRETVQVRVTALIRQSMGQDVHMRDAALFALLRQTPQVNAIHLLIDPLALPALQAAVKTTPAIAGLIDWVQVRGQFDATLNESLLTMTMIYTGLGMLITLGVIYNAARIQLSERSHELASLRVLGFTRAEVGFVLVGELMVLALAALPLGWAAGYGFAALITAGFSSDLVSMPLVVDRRTFAFAAVVVLTTALVTALIVRRRLDRIDLVSALKQKE